MSALDTIVKALVAAGCESAQSPEAVTVLRQLGGYTAVIERAAEARLASLPGNPRLSDDLRQRIQRGLRGRVADARVQVQAFISNAVIAPGGKAHEAGTPAAAQSARCRRVRRARAPVFGVACRGHAHGAATAADGAGGPAAHRRARGSHHRLQDRGRESQPCGATPAVRAAMGPRP